MAFCRFTARGSSKTYATHVHCARSLAMRRRLWLFERKWLDGSKIVSSKPSLLRQSVYRNKRRVDRSPRSRAESLAWGGLACSILFLRSPGPCCTFKLQIAVEDRRRLFFLRPFFGTHGLRKTPKLQVVLLAQVPSVSKSQALFPRESDGKAYFHFICSSVDDPYPDRPPWKSLKRALSRLMTGFLHLSCNLLTLTWWGFIRVLKSLPLTPMISGSRQRKAELE
ncbi:hypothetical protein SCLCIDRAFT_586183 [Scleroderma citrinum Foug A]|uniref:Uncharacterized protein n=1 Tax=Scleroderma citrinum Foug A TaxID=1036808 RepID=A0A0C2ZU92_9AGAM|nr:hypothetical protein SCLCIDRAFT_586183 [Scleroderma citrinum Foug A]